MRRSYIDHMPGSGWRLRRGPELPAFAADEMEQRRTYKPIFDLRRRDGAWRALFRRERWKRVAEWESSVRRRESFCWVTGEESERVAALQLVEFEMDGFETNGSFFDALDSHSEADMLLAEALCSAWEDVPGEVAAWGPLVEFRAVWAHPRAAPHGLWADVANELLRRRYAHRSILVLKPFPLEYEGQLMQHPEARPGLHRRRNAMRRYYERLLGATPLAGMEGEHGWLWVPGRPEVPSPQDIAAD